ncbi:hypothetical protein [Herbidospora sp. RD11066]
MRLLVSMAVLALLVGGCGTDATEGPLINEGLADLEKALTRTVTTEGVAGDLRQSKGPWPCRSEGESAYSLNYYGKSADPRAAVKAVIARWRQERYLVDFDRADHPDQPEAGVRGRLVELSVHGFLDRGTVWIGGNTACLEGDVPEIWQNVR